MVAKEAISNRHEGDLGGQLAPFSEAQRVVVRVVVPAAVAPAAAVQHTVWMVLNLLVRTDGIVTEVVLDCPNTVLVNDQTVPFGSAQRLRDRLIEAANLIGNVRVIVDDGRPAQRHVDVNVKPTTSGNDICVIGAGWWGGVALRGEVPNWAGMNLDNRVPFGPYIAAALAVGEIYLTARVARILDPARPAVYGWDNWSQAMSTTPVDAPNPTVDMTGTSLAGAGAVGSVWMHAIWAYPNSTGTVVVVDDDREGVSQTNLNRGVLFTRDNVQVPKAQAAAANARGSVLWDPRTGKYELQEVETSLLISAVDKNRARDALQNTYPAMILGGSTSDLRAEVFRLGTLGVGACLRCFNPLEPASSDIKLREQAVDDDVLMDQLAAELRTSSESVEAKLRDPGCDRISDDMIAWLREHLGEPELPQFAVGFVSVASGTMLAAETIKVLAGRSNDSELSACYRFQFFNPSMLNGVTLQRRETACPKCQPGGSAVKVWNRRHAPFILAAAAGDSMARGPHK